MSANFNPEGLKQKFYSLSSFEDLAELLEIPKNKLYYYTYKADKKKHYRKFDIPKKSGGTREIHAPSTPLKIIQQKLNQILQAVYIPKASVHGFVRDKGILTNAKRHLENGRKRYIFNLDLKDFFPTITSKRITGLLMSVPYNLPFSVASAITQLCCFNNQLPQGAPTSPILSNMICAKMDTEIRILAQQSKCTYTRYADDISISTTLPKFPSAFAVTNALNVFIVGGALSSIIENNGFKINEKKVRLLTRNNRQEITGLTVNKFPNIRRSFVRQIRAMLYAWDKFGLEQAQVEYQKKFYPDWKGTAPSFKKVVRGKLEFLRMVRGEENQLYIRLSNQLSKLDPGYKKPDKFIGIPSTPVYVVTEGKSDWKHLKASLSRFQANGVYTGLNIEFWEFDDAAKMNNAELLKLCEGFKLQNKDKVNIYIFDSDAIDINKKVNDSDKGYRKWVDRLFSFTIPTPSHRRETPEISIEFYYKDNEIMQPNLAGNRLYINTEFHKNSLRHLTIEDLSTKDNNKVVKSPLSIIDANVFTGQSKNVALPKDDFASNILNNVEGFDNFDISEFKLIFNQIVKILKDESP